MIDMPKPQLISLNEIRLGFSEAGPATSAPP